MPLLLPAADPPGEPQPAWWPLLPPYLRALVTKSLTHHGVDTSRWAK